MSATEWKKRMQQGSLDEGGDICRRDRPPAKRATGNLKKQYTVCSQRFDSCIHTLALADSHRRQGARPHLHIGKIIKNQLKIISNEGTTLATDCTMRVNHKLRRPWRFDRRVIGLPEAGAIGRCETNRGQTSKREAAGHLRHPGELVTAGRSSDSAHRASFGTEARQKHTLVTDKGCYKVYARHRQPDIWA
jgi:hypothetical protein